MTLLINRLTAVCLLTAAFSTPSFAQDKHDDHTGHDHGNEQEVVSTAPKAPVTHVMTAAPEDHMAGEDSAPTTLIAYASVTCPHCATFFNEEWPTIKKDLVDTGKVKMILREVPTEPARMAMTGFILANCAPEGEFISHIEYQMEIQESLFKRLEAGDGKAAYDEMAAKAGMNSEDEMTACFNNEAAFNHIYDSMERAEAAKIGGLPAFYINGEKVGAKTTVLEALTAASEAGVSKMPK